jgi:hypothetical protein
MPHRIPRKVAASAHSFLIWRNLPAAASLVVRDGGALREEKPLGDLVRWRWVVAKDGASTE